MPITAQEALRYATHDELLKLYGVFVGGWALTIFGQLLTSSMRNSAAVIGVVLLIAGVTVSLAALVATLYKVISEGTKRNS